MRFARACALSFLVGLALVSIACGGEPPDKEIQQAQGALDAARAAGADRYAADVLGTLRMSSHGQYLESIGLGDDLIACAQVDALRIVPVSREGRITLDA